MRLRRTGDPTLVRRVAKRDPYCVIDGCDRGHYARGWCEAHYFRWRKRGDPAATQPVLRQPDAPTCQVEGCDRRYHGKGYCQAHLRRVRLYADPLATTRPDLPDAAISRDSV